MSGYSADEGNTSLSSSVMTEDDVGASRTVPSSQYHSLEISRCSNKTPELDDDQSEVFLLDETATNPQGHQHQNEEPALNDEESIDGMNQKN